MTEPAPRPTSTRGRGGGRGGRGGSRGSTRPRDRHTNGDRQDPAPVEDAVDEGEIGEMKKKYAMQIEQVKDIFSEESIEDIAFALDEAGGDTTAVIDQISEGRFSRFETKTAKDRTKLKSKDQTAAAPGAPHTTSKATRARGGHDTARGAPRGRGERGRGGSRGSRGGHAGPNGVRSSADTKSAPASDGNWTLSAPPAEGNGSPSWDATAAADANGTAATTTSSVTPAASSGAPKPTSLSDGAPKQSWAQLLRKPDPVPVIPKPAQAAALETTPIPIEKPAAATAAAQETLPIPAVSDEVPTNEALEEPTSLDEPSLELTPSKDQLTEENLEHLPDTSHPAPTGTVASTIDSHSATPLVVPHAQQAPIGRPPMGGFATSAHRATGTPRSASFQRRFMEQQEAVVMPGNHAIDRAAVQFGSMGLNGDAEPDVDEDREDAETRQPPQLSPPSQPRASLPPALRQAAVPADSQRPDSTQAVNPAPGLLATQPQQPTQSPSTQLASQNVGQQPSQAGQPYNQFGRIGQGLPTDAAAPRPYDPFGQHQTQQSAFDNYPSHSQAAGQAQQQSQLGGISSGPTDFSSYYTSDHSRNPYPNYYGGGYGQQNTSNQQEQGTSQQRTGSTFSGSAADLGYTPNNSSSQPRYGATASDNAQHSGHTTPNPTVGSGAAGATTGVPSAQQPSSQPQQSQQQPFNQQTPQGHTGAQHPGYGSYNSYYNSPYYASYMNQFHYGQGAGGYGGGPFGRNNYAAGGPAAHHGYGLPSHSAYDQQSSSPANVGGFGGSSLQDRAPGLGGLSDYARSGSAQGGNQTGGAFGGMGGDTFGRSPSGFPSQNTPYGQQSSNQQQQSGGNAENDPLKPFGDPKGAGGPSPGLPGRPSSAANQPSGLPPPQSQHGGFGPFGSQFGQGAYGSLGGLGGQHGQHGAGGYSGGFGSGYANYGGGYGRGGGWGGNYASH